MNFHYTLKFLSIPLSCLSPGKHCYVLLIEGTWHFLELYISGIMYCILLLWTVFPNSPCGMILRSPVTHTATNTQTHYTQIHPHILCINNPLILFVIQYSLYHFFTSIWVVFKF